MAVTNNRKNKMKNWGVLGLLLALPACVSLAHAEDDAPSAPASDAAVSSSGQTDAARDALKQKANDATSEKNLQQVFQASQPTYSLLKTGKVGFMYDASYSFYQNNSIDLALSSSGSQITRFRIQNVAQHTFSNVLELDYGVRDNLTFTSSLPLVAAVDTQNNLKTTGLGDVAFGLRWQPIPLKNGLPTTTLFASFSTATGDSPYEINTSKDIATGKGYYSLSGGASVSKVADPIVIFASMSYTMNTSVSDLNQYQGGRVLNGVSPGDSIGASMGLAYALNYDVSITSSYQQSYAFGSQYDFQASSATNGRPVTVTSPGAMSASLNFSLGLRTNPKRIINISFGYGLTANAPNVTLGFSMPIDFLGNSDE
jgi:hypothetical protein